MGKLAGMVRFLIGAAMLAGGATLVMPFAGLVVAGLQAAGHGHAVPALGAAPPLAQPAAPMQPPATAPQGQWMVPEAALPPPVELRGEYTPPPPPERLPVVPASLGAEGPGMNGTYRSTLAVPPPPLLDAQALPPAVAAVVEQQRPPSAQPGAVSGGVPPPAAYVIRDGDDLTGISVRFYGHPAAAAAVWEANRDVIPDPALLPIGATLRMPPPWSIPGLPGAAPVGRSIEPPASAAVPRARPETNGSGAWLLGGPAPPPETPSRPVTGGSVRLAPGETLESLAVRFYGDRSAATRIWEANRDRLRSPELAVTGMELRLP